MKICKKYGEKIDSTKIESVKMKTKVECEATLSIEVPLNFSADIVTKTGGHGNDVTIKKLYFRSYRQPSEEAAKILILEVIDRLTKALNE